MSPPAQGGSGWEVGEKKTNARWSEGCEPKWHRRAVFSSIYASMLKHTASKYLYYSLLQSSKKRPALLPLFFDQLSWHVNRGMWASLFQITYSGCVLPRGRQRIQDNRSLWFASPEIWAPQQIPPRSIEGAQLSHCQIEHAQYYLGRRDRTVTTLSGRSQNHGKSCSLITIWKVHQRLRNPGWWVKLGWSLSCREGQSPVC